MSIRFSTKLCTSIRQNPEQPNLIFVKEGDNPIIEKVSGIDGVLA